MNPCGQKYEDGRSAKCLTFQDGPLGNKWLIQVSFFDDGEMKKTKCSNLASTNLEWPRLSHHSYLEVAIINVSGLFLTTNNMYIFKI